MDSHLIIGLKNMGRSLSGIKQRGWYHVLNLWVSQSAITVKFMKYRYRTNYPLLAHFIGLNNRPRTHITSHQPPQGDNNSDSKIRDSKWKCRIFTGRAFASRIKLAGRRKCEWVVLQLISKHIELIGFSIQVCEALYLYKIIEEIIYLNILGLFH